MRVLVSVSLTVCALYLLSICCSGALGQGEGGSCWAARLCCQGKNLTCRVSSSAGAARNHVEGEEKDSKLSMCFCDSACLELNDCCHDYKIACQPVDCAVTDDWSDWSECDARCGPGVKYRTRRVLRRPMNGGKPCPPIKERIACEGTSCKVARASEEQEELRESGKIIPASFGDWRNDVKYNPFKDIRRNLFEKYHEKNLKVDRPSYCMKFEFTEVWSACQTNANNETSEIFKGNTVCVECQPQAMKKSLGSRCKGHGVLMKETRWKAVLTSGCHGKWVLKSRQEDCKCQSSKNSDFIFL